MALQVVGELLFTVGVLFLFFVAYQFLGKPAEVAHAQERLDAGLEQAWQAPSASSAEPVTRPHRVHQGEPFVRLAVPGLDKRWAVVEGVSQAALRNGPGHYPGTAMPGKLGNFAVAGHRSSGVFLDLDRVSNGDVVAVETRDAWFTYRVYQRKIVQPDELGVIKPNPDRPGARPTRAVLTLTTCEPKWSSARRLIIHAELADVRTKH
ncbi:class E sortase [Qaidamihabitans albus]|uniref:class E sortase n=1 Tax=Qaidamihabitans albus TaxID=2795733 RepID=UPI0018F1F98C|nr:class E sortase [Qaidamihabitans albus]